MGCAQDEPGDIRSCSPSTGGSRGGPEPGDRRPVPWEALRGPELVQHRRQPGAATAGSTRGPRRGCTRSPPAAPARRSGPGARRRAGRGWTSRPRTGSSRGGRRRPCDAAQRTRAAAGGSCGPAPTLAPGTPWCGDATVMHVAASVRPADLDGIAGHDPAQAVADEVDPVGARRRHEVAGPGGARRRDLRDGRRQRVVVQGVDVAEPGGAEVALEEHPVGLVGGEAVHEQHRRRHRRARGPDHPADLLRAPIGEAERPERGRDAQRHRLTREPANRGPCPIKHRDPPLRAPRRARAAATPSVTATLNWWMVRTSSSRRHVRP